MRLPNFIIIGAMKAGTTTLYDQMRRQPGLYLPALKEPNFFSDDSHYVRGIEWYSRLFASAHSDDLIGEASTHYTKLPTYPCTVARMRMVLKNPRFIYVMRHPIDRLVSQYIHQWSQGEITCDLEEAIKRHPELVHYSCYALQLKPYVEAFGMKAILPIFFERMLSDPGGTFSRIWQFIGYKPAPESSVRLESCNASKERVRRFPFYDLLINSRVASGLRRTFVPKSLRDAVRQQLTMERRPELCVDTRRRLELLFNKDLALLGDWLDHPISCQNFHPPKISRE